ncbi:hypothetical protein [Burkholderia gladioli]|uniref:hypothetical protein n=1 Tax=Burkholderia gladioli TaxID=28095 RepID=UPI0011B291F7|nr:hypothetical protein [Burkholderia gladioli]
MSFNARVYRVLIASPSDVTQEREMVVQAIQEWNNLNAAERAVTLLPLRWETHAAPMLGDRPQAIINRQIVDECDALIGVFWTRIGSPTGVADSGTLEEIERTVNAGRPAMLYFSSAPQVPDLIDPPQLQSLRAFKKNIQNKGLIQTYSSLTDFKDLLARHLEHQVRTWMSARSDEMEGTASRSQVADITVAFDPVVMNLNDAAESGTLGSVVSDFLIIENLESIPDYSTDPTPAKKQTLGLLALSKTDNSNYFRETAASLRDKAFRRVAFQIENAGTLGARDVYLDIVVSGSTPITIAAQDALMLRQPEKVSHMFSRAPQTTHQRKDSWRISAEIGAMQPQRIRDWMTNWYIAAWSDCEVTFEITIYADILPQPTKRTLKIDWRCKPVEMSVESFMKLMRNEDTTETP